MLLKLTDFLLKMRFFKKKKKLKNGIFKVFKLEKMIKKQIENIFGCGHADTKMCKKAKKRINKSWM